MNTEMQTKLKKLSEGLEQEKEDAIRKALLDAGESALDIEKPEYLAANGYIRQQPLYETGPETVETFIWKGKPRVEFGPLQVTKTPTDDGGLHIEAFRDIRFITEDEPEAATVQ